jgi:hypothetical protein
MSLSEQPKDAVGTTKWWDEYFQPSGGWETNRGRIQTRLFAEAFVKHSGLDRERSITLLDVGCALGDAILVLHKHFPNAALTGIDISGTSIRRCQIDLGHLAAFEVCPIEKIGRFYDVIYASNVLEHFTDFKEKARHLITYCKHLFILVPFMEMHNGKPLEPDPYQHHQYTFGLHSFDYLMQEKMDIAVHSKVFFCRGAWSWTEGKWVKETFIRNPLRWLFRKPIQKDPRLILYDIQSSRNPDHPQPNSAQSL